MYQIWCLFFIFSLYYIILPISISMFLEAYEEVNMELEDRRKYLLTEFESLKLKKNAKKRQASSKVTQKEISNRRRFMGGKIRRWR